MAILYPLFVINQVFPLAVHTCLKDLNLQ